MPDRTAMQCYYITKGHDHHEHGSRVLNETTSILARVSRSLFPCLGKPEQKPRFHKPCQSIIAFCGLHSAALQTLVFGTIYHSEHVSLKLPEMSAFGCFVVGSSRRRRVAAQRFQHAPVPSRGCTKQHRTAVLPDFHLGGVVECIPPSSIAPAMPWRKAKSRRFPGREAWRSNWSDRRSRLLPLRRVEVDLHLTRLTDRVY